MKFLLHMDDEEVSIKLDHNTYIIPPGKAVRIDRDFHAERIMEHKAYHGLVEVEQVPDGEGGFKLDMKGAKERAKLALDAADDQCANEYMKTQLEDRIRLNFPALPPQGRALKVIRRRGVDLLAQGIKPVGYEVERQRQMEAESVATLKEENAKLSGELSEIRGMLDQLLSANVKSAKATKSTDAA